MRIATDDMTLIANDTDLDALDGPGLGAAAAGLRARREVRHVPARGTRVLVTRAHLTRGGVNLIILPRG